MLGTFILATSGLSCLHNPWYYFGFFSLLIHLVRIQWVSLRFYAYYLSWERTTFYSFHGAELLLWAVVCDLWLRLGSRYTSRWVLWRQGDLLFVHYICVFIGHFCAIADLIGPDSWVSIRFCGYDRSNDLACEHSRENTLWYEFFISLLFLDDSCFLQ